MALNIMIATILPLLKTCSNEKMEVLVFIYW